MNTAYDRESLDSLACFFECYLKRALFFLGCVLCLLIIMTGWMLKLKIEQHCGGNLGLKGYAKPVRKSRKQSQDVGYSTSQSKITETQNISHLENNKNLSKFEQDIKSKNDGQVVDILKPKTTGSEHSSEQKYGKQKNDWDVNAGEARSTINSDKPCGILRQFLECVKEGFANPSSSTSDAPQEQNEQQKESFPPHTQTNTKTTIYDKNTSQSEKHKERVLKSEALDTALDTA